MHDLAAIRKDPEAFRKGLARKGSAEALDPVLELEEQRRTLIQEAEGLRAKQNAACQEIAEKKRSGENADDAIAAMRDVKAAEKEASARLAEVETELTYRVRMLPNLPADDVPDGESEDDNVEISRWGEPPSFDFEPKPHWELAEDMGIFEPDTAGTMSGSGFTLLLGEGARLERALGQFLLDQTTKVHGYREVSPPVLVRPDALDATTILEKYEIQMYRQRDDELYLIPTAETPLTNLHRDAILDEESLPRRYTALTPCFRREAGAAGRDTRGMLRVHQCWKVEMMTYCHPDKSNEEHEAMRGHAEHAVQALGLHYRVVKVCTGDMSAANERQYDLEVWAPGVDKFLEISSVSNFGAWQARRAGTRFRSGKGKPQAVHTLNGSALGMPRVLVAILENGQRADGTVVIPEVLRPYMDGQEVLGA
ncbi:MAG: serine--tRNA ligase [Planctomycetota bacterium]